MTWIIHWHPEDGIDALLREGMICTLTYCQGNKTRAAEVSGMCIRTVRAKVRKLELKEFYGPCAPSARKPPGPRYRKKK